MAGTYAGGKAAAAKNLANNPNFYSDIGRIGGKNGRTGGFAKRVRCVCDWSDYAHEKQQCCGAKGGMISRRRKVNMEK